MVRNIYKYLHKPPIFYEYLNGYNVVRKVVKVIDKLATDPKPSGVKKLKASDENLYRVRSGDYMIIYAVAEEVKIVNIRRIRHRKEVYRNL